MKQLFAILRVVIRNIFFGANLLSLSLLLKPQSFVSYCSENLFLYRTLLAKRGIEQKNIFQILPTSDIETISLGNLRRATWFHSTSSYAMDITNLCMICKSLKPKVIFEIGTLDGYTSLHFALNTTSDAVIYTLDLPKKSKADVGLKTTYIDDQHIKASLKMDTYCFDNTDVKYKIHNLFGDSAFFDFDSYEGKVDFFFIDGAHSYEYVRSDTENALRCCHKGSVIAWHDFGRVGLNGVSKWILELSKHKKIYATPGGSLAFMIV